MTKTNNLINSTKYWHERVFHNKNLSNITKNNLEKKIYKHLKQEVPSLLSVVFERMCNLNCQHCFYADTKCSSKKISDKENITEAILRLVSQIPKKSIIDEIPQFLHSGRILLPWHVEVMAKVRKARNDIRIGIIDNGSFVNHIAKFKQKNLLLDWADISLDGSKKTHNNQRPAKNIDAFDLAINGLREVRKILKLGGYVASLFTMTKLNYFDIENTADILFTQNPNDKKHKLADLMAITTMTPTNGKNEKIETSIDFTKDNKEFGIAWQQIKNVTKKYGENKIIVHIYRHFELEKIAKVVGEKNFLKALAPKEIEIGLHEITFVVDGIRVRFSPLSTWPKEEMVIDADGVIRTALSGCYSLKEFKKDEIINGKDIKRYSIEKADKNTDYVKVYQKTAEQWWNKFGKDYIQEEQEVFDRIKKRAK
jgi:MoaA/NifB/PqqE/SkfB family radical SAM enzyme